MLLNVRFKEQTCRRPGHTRRQEAPSRGHGAASRPERNGIRLGMADPSFTYVKFGDQGSVVTRLRDAGPQRTGPGLLQSEQRLGQHAVLLSLTSPGAEFLERSAWAGSVEKAVFT